MKTKSEIDTFLETIEKTKTVNLDDFFNLQKDIKLLPWYRTMGPEFEFATLRENVPIHVALATSQTTINNLPVVIETDAGNVIEIACPPFVVATDMDSWESAKLRSMIITDVLEKKLRSIAEDCLKEGKNLEQLVKEIGNLFGVRFTYTNDYEALKNVKFLPFRKGMDLVKGSVTEKDKTNAQINIAMSLSEVAMALRASNKDSLSRHTAFRRDITSQLKELFNRRSEHYSRDENFENRVAIITFFVSQIPLMALQNTMNVVRDEKKFKTKTQTRDDNRKEFKNSHPDNAKLLTELSRIKDNMGFWLKSGLNNFIKEDPVIREMILEMSKNGLKDYIIEGIDYPGKYMTGLEEYSGRHDIWPLYKSSVNSIVEGLFTMAESNAIVSPSKTEFPVFTDEGKSPSLLTDYKNGAPFMARPDTFVNMPAGKHLVEIRALNKGIFKNDYLRSFQMPYYRMYGELADKNSQDIYKDPKQRRLEQFTTPVNHMQEMHSKADVKQSSANENRRNQRITRF